MDTSPWRHVGNKIAALTNSSNFDLNQRIEVCLLPHDSTYGNSRVRRVFLRSIHQRQTVLMDQRKGNTPNVHERVTSAQGQELLATLIGFIQPIIQASLSSASYLSSEHDLARGTQLQPRTHSEGQNLLNALAQFVTSIGCIQSTDVQETGDLPKEHGPTSASASPEAPPHEEPESLKAKNDEKLLEYGGLKNSINNTLRVHVFNKMPIRVLTFDSNGLDLQLIDRTEIYGRVLKKVCAEAVQPQFQSAWREIVGLSGNPFVPNALSGYFERTARERKIITELVERHSRYAILSHTWIRDVPGDVIYQGWNSREKYPDGYRKVAYFCAVAAQAHGVGFGWMDNVCINKDSSSELDESIRSMYKWYRGAHVCISFMSQTWDLAGMKDDSWFTRGWTLQELLAPHDNYFYNGNWEYLGSSTDEAIRSVIQSASTITRAELEACQSGETDKIPISRRFQLAAKRQVTREEDMVYSLMGLLGVDISVAYGEGTEHAFFRLVREILVTKKDVLDIFSHGYYPSRKIIPATIDNYRIRSTTIYTPSSEGKLQQSQWQPSEPIVLTHLGVRIPLLLVHALKVDRFDAQCVPVGDLCGSIQMSLSASYMHYSVLDERIYKNNLTTGGGSETSKVPLVATLGVLNFGTVDDNILLPRDCLFVPLDCGTVKPGTVRPYDNVKILDASGSVFAGLTFDEHVTQIARQNLATHGVQLITLHL